VRFALPQCFAAPKRFGRIVGARLGLLGFYMGEVFSAIEFSPVKFLGGGGDDRGRVNVRR
jgi:hypothetical protein